MNADPPTLTEHDDHWVLPFHGTTVISVRVDFHFQLDFDDDSFVRIGGVATLSGADVEAVELDPERQDVAAGLTLFNAQVKSAIAVKSGDLRVEFEDGRTLCATHDERHEAWSACGPGGMLVVSLPGGDLAVWSSR